MPRFANPNRCASTFKHTSSLSSNLLTFYRALSHRRPLGRRPASPPTIKTLNSWHLYNAIMFSIVQSKPVSQFSNRVSQWPMGFNTGCLPLGTRNSLPSTFLQLDKMFPRFQVAAVLWCSHDHGSRGILFERRGEQHKAVLRAGHLCHQLQGGGCSGRRVREDREQEDQVNGCVDEHADKPNRPDDDIGRGHHHDAGPDDDVDRVAI